NGKRRMTQIRSEGDVPVCLKCSGGAFLLVSVMTGSALAANGTTSVVDAIRNGDREAVRVLLKQRANVNAAEADGTTALHWAVRVHDDDTARLLIRAGADVKAANRYGITPLSLAATNGDAAMIDVLVKA